MSSFVWYMDAFTSVAYLFASLPPVLQTKTCLGLLVQHPDNGYLQRNTITSKVYQPLSSVQVWFGVFLRIKKEKAEVK